MYTILVTGSKGQLGSEIADLKGQFLECTFLLTDKEELDITNAIQIEEFVIKNNINEYPKANVMSCQRSTMRSVSIAE